MKKTNFNSFTLLIVLLSFCITISSCKKETSSTPKVYAKAEGSWKQTGVAKCKEAGFGCTDASGNGFTGDLALDEKRGEAFAEMKGADTVVVRFRYDQLNISQAYHDLLYKNLGFDTKETTSEKPEILRLVYSTFGIKGFPDTITVPVGITPVINKIGSKPALNKYVVTDYFYISKSGNTREEYVITEK